MGHAIGKSKTSSHTSTRGSVRVFYMYLSIHPSIYTCIYVCVYICISGHTSTGAQVLVLWLGLGCGHLHPVHQRGKPRSELKLPGTVQFGLGLGLGLGLVGVAWNQ